MANIWQKIGNSLLPRWGVNKATKTTYQNINGTHVYMYGKTDWLNDNYIDIYEKCPFTFSAINERATQCSKVKFFVKDLDGKIIENDPFYDLIAKPNRYQSTEDFIKQFMIYLSVHGSNIIYPITTIGSKDIKDVKSLINISPSNLEVENTKDYLINEITEQEYEPKVWFRGEREKYLLENIMPFYDTTNGLDADNPFTATSRIKPLLKPISNVWKIMEAQNMLFSSPGGIGILSSGGSGDMASSKMQPEDKTKLEDAIFKKHGLSSSKNPFIVTSANVNFQSTIGSIKEFEFNASIVQNGLSIYAGIGVPKEKFPFKEGSTFENQKESELNWIQGDIQKNVDNIASTFTNQFNYREQGKQIIASMEHLPIMAEIKKTNAEQLNIATKSITDLLSANLITQDKAKELLTQLTIIT